MTCWICSDHEQCPYPVCYEQEQLSKQLREEWESQKAMSQEEIREEQLEFNLGE